MKSDDRRSPRGRVVLVDDSVVYQWPIGSRRLVLRWREGDELTAKIEPLHESAPGRPGGPKRPADR